MRTRTMKPLFLIFCLCLSPLLMGQNQNKIQEAMANYDYETAVELINKEPPTIPLLMQKAKALKGIGSNAEALRSIRQVIARVKAVLRRTSEKSKEKEMRAFFGTMAEYKIKEDGEIQITVPQISGPQFFGWLTAMGKDVHILKPKKTAVAYRDYLKTLAKEYKGV